MLGGRCVLGVPRVGFAKPVTARPKERAMSILPSRTQDLLEWFDLHSPVWADEAANIGLTPAQAAEFGTLAATARAKYIEQLDAEEAARVAANQARDAIARARRSASDLIRSIKGFAANAPAGETLSVYNAAQIPMAAPPSPVGPPGKPHDITVTLTPTTGDITLRWKVVNPVGTVGTSYIVKRRIGGGGTSQAAEFQFVGVTGNKEFTDTTLEGGAESVQYIVQGQRSRHAGPVSDILTVNFGQRVDRQVAARDGAVKLAA